MDKGIRIKSILVQRESPYLIKKERFAYTKSLPTFNSVFSNASKDKSNAKVAMFYRLNRQGQLEDIEKHQSLLTTLKEPEKSISLEIKNLTQQLSSVAIEDINRQKLSSQKENLEKFIIEFEKIVSKKITLEQLQPNIAIDMEINIEEIDYKLFRIIDQISPFGPTNKRPIFLSKSVSDSGFAKQVGDMKNHLKLNIIKNGKVIPAIGFNMGQYLQSINRVNNFDICYSIDQNEWNGRKELQIQILDLKISS